MIKKKSKIIIGRLEKIDLPELAVFNLDAKIDTGAYTSSLHCHHINTEYRNDELWVTFCVLDPDHPEYEERFFESPVHSVRSVKSSNGQAEDRVVIRQQAVFWGKSRTIELSLTDRSDMKFPVLLGRKFISGRYVVDVSKQFLYKEG